MKSYIDKDKLVYYDKTTNTSTCHMCQRVLSGRLLANIKRHYRVIHGWDFENDSKPTLASKSVTAAPETSTESAELLSSKRRLEKLPPSLALKRRCGSLYQNVTLTLTKEEFLKSCMGMVIAGITPLEIFDDEDYFKPIIAPYENIYQLNLSSNELLERISGCAQSMREYLSTKLCRKMVSLKLNVIKAMDRNFLSICVQHVEGVEMAFCTLGLFELEKDCKAAHLKEFIIKCLSERSIDITHIYACTVDSDDCLLAAAHLLQQDLQGFKKKKISFTVITPNDDYDNEDEDEEEENNDKHELIQARQQSILVVMRSAAATINHTVQDSFQHISAKLEQCRKIVCTLNNSERDWGDVTLPTLDINHADDWHCTYYMLVALNNMRSTISEEKEFVTLIDWEFVKEVPEAYQPMLECSRGLENACTVGDFYRDWLMCEAKLERLEGNDFAKMLLESMQAHKCSLLECDAFLAALYFDPRFNYVDSPLMNEYHKRNAVLHIMDTATLIDLSGVSNCKAGIQKQHNKLESTVQQVTIPPDDPFDLLEVKINSIAANNSASGKSNFNLPQKLDDLAYGQRKPFSTNILEYWKAIAQREMELTEIALVVLSAAISQLPAELNSEMLSSVLENESWFNGSSELLNNFLFVKANQKLMKLITLIEEK